MVIKKVAGLVIAATLPAMGLLMTPASTVVAAPTAHLLPAMDHILPNATLAKSKNLGAVNPSNTFSFGVVLPSRNPTGLAKMAQAVSQPGSSYYHQFLSPSQVNRAYGPKASVVSEIIAKFKKAGFRAVQQNQMVMVTGTVGKVNQLFNTVMTRYSRGTGQYVAPNSALALPSWLRSAAGLTGFAQGTPNTGFVQAKHLATTYAPASHMKPTPRGANSSAQNGNFAVSVTRVTNGSRAPGLAERYLVTATLNGQVTSDPLAVTGLSGPYKGAASLTQWYSNPSSGQIVMDFTMTQAQTVSMAAHIIVVDPNTGATLGSVTVQLPSATFLGPATKVSGASQFFKVYGIHGKLVAPWNPKTNDINKVFNAEQLVQAGTTGTTPTIGVYTAGGISNNGSYTGIGFSVPENDANLFASQFHRTPEQFSVGYVGPNSVPDSSYGGIEGEMSLDLQMMETSAPGSHIVVYSAGSLRSALNQVDAQNRVSVFSISYGGGEQVEQFFAPGAQASWDQLAQIGNLEGITISVSAGDSGAYSGAEYLGYDGTPNSVALAPQPSYPANSAYVSAIGGTEDAVTPHSSLGQAAMWGGNIGSELSHTTLLEFLSQQNMMASGGISTIEAAPSYQTQLNPGLSGRMTPDIALPASVVTPGYYAWFDGGPNLSGGTSAGAPLFAGWMADLANVEGPMGNVNPLLYHLYQQPTSTLPLGAITTPVAFGNNGAYSVSSKDNAVTGLGQLNVDAFYAATR